MSAISASSTAFSSTPTLGDGPLTTSTYYGALQRKAVELRADSLVGEIHQEYNNLLDLHCDKSSSRIPGGSDLKKLSMDFNVGISRPDLYAKAVQTVFLSYGDVNTDIAAAIDPSILEPQSNEQLSKGVVAVVTRFLYRNTNADKMVNKAEVQRIYSSLQAARGSSNSTESLTARVHEILGRFLEVPEQENADRAPARSVYSILRSFFLPPDIPMPLDSCFSMVAYYDNVDGVKATLAAGADVHTKEDQVLHGSVTHNLKATVKYLLTTGVDVHALKGDDLKTACTGEDTDLAITLLAAGMCFETE